MVVTGASSGLGAGLAAAFHEAGASVVLASRHADTLEEQAARLPGCVAVPCDVTAEDDRQRLVRTAETRFGRVHVLVNNAGFARSAPALDETDPDVRRTWETNLHAPYALSRTVARRMVDGDGGSIVNVASLSALRSFDRYALASYAASKAGLVALTRELAAQWGRQGVRVNAVAPGWFPTRMTGQLEDNAQVDWIVAHTSLGRPGRVDELAAAVLFLAGDAASYVTGQLLAVDGGWL